jgi:hypothetical protein
MRARHIAKKMERQRIPDDAIVLFLTTAYAAVAVVAWIVFAA